MDDTAADAQPLRLGIFFFVGIVLFAALGARLWYLQTIEHEELRVQAETNALRAVYEEAPRGRILDRSGRVLVDNKTVHVVTLDRSVIDDLDEAARDDLYLRLATAVSRSGRLTKVSDIESEYADRDYGPLERVPVAVDVDPDLAVFTGERADLFPGVHVTRQTIRVYPYGDLAAHLLGYVGPITRAEWEATRIDDGSGDLTTDYRLNHEIGKSGIERLFESDLRGTPGVRYIEVDANSRPVREWTERYRPPVPGHDVWLTVDIDLQALAENELDRGLAEARSREPDSPSEPAFVASAGSVVMLDPRSGALLAMASYPSYEPGEFVEGISISQFERLTSEDNHSPILNRAIQGSYAPGSTFKLVSAYAALAEGVIGPSGIRGVNEGYRDTGDYVYSGCFEESDTCRYTSPYEGPGRWVDLAAAITVSSDPYFYEIGGEGFWRRSRDDLDDDGTSEDEDLQLWARLLGLGVDTGIQLPYERSGAVPDREYYQRQYDLGVFGTWQWFGGSTINLAIGQGELLVTPLQLANAYAAFANGGRLHQPNTVWKVTEAAQTSAGQAETRTPATVREIGPRVLRDLQIPAEFHGPIEEGLLGVPRADGAFRGTAWRAFRDAGFPLDLWPVAGKTGTAEVTGVADTSLFAAYGPVRAGSEPEVAIAVVLEEAGFGSSAAAPVAARILARIADDSVEPARQLDETVRVSPENP